MPKISLCKYIPFQSHGTADRQLVTASMDSEFPFVIQRVYYVMGVRSDDKRGNHANIKNRQVMVAISGSFKVMVDDGEEKKSFTIDKNTEGFYLPEKLWRSVYDFSSDAICMVFCSEKYDVADYVKDFNEFLVLKNIP
jgi:dTDP-4-dehydrorhamnose 3,5-epimerase-like enzyme